VGKRGTKPVATRLKILSGVRAGRINTAEPVAPGGVPECPDHLDKFGQEAWARVVSQLDALGILSAVDADALALYCVTYSRWRFALIDLENHGLSVSTGQGGFKSNPASSVVAESSRLLVSLLGEFGLTPASRSRVKVPAASPKDALGVFLGRKKAR
jgi:P27 family predicted phage terminase small subunit